MIKIDNSTLFFGQDLGDKKDEFISKVDVNYALAFDVKIEPKHEVDEFLVEFNDGTNCAGIAIIEDGLAQVIYIAGFGSDKDDFNVKKKMGI